MSKKVLKSKYVTLKELEFIVLYNRMQPSKAIYKLPFYKTKVKKDRINLNIFDKEGLININDIKYVKLTVGKFIYHNQKINTDMTLYSYKDKKIKLIKPDKLYKPSSVNNDCVGLLVPFEIFKIMIISSVNETPKGLSYLLTRCDDIFSIKLMDKNKKCIGYALRDIEID